MEGFVVRVYPDYIQMQDLEGVRILASIFVDADIEQDQAIRLFLEILRQQIYTLMRR